MKAVIFAGGMGTRFAEETDSRPKPMIEIGGMPILWHLMKIYSHYGINDFVVCLGYKGNYIKEWFNKYYLHRSDVTFDLFKNEIVHHKNDCEHWKVTLVDTGLTTLTAGRLAKIKEYVNNETFMATYGDGLSDIDLNKLLAFHKKHGKIATVTSVIPEGRFGIIEKNSDNQVSFFGEKVDNDRRVNGGFFVLEPNIFDYVADNNGNPLSDTPFEKDPLENLTKDGELFAFEHNGFWAPMDTQRDKIKLEELWQTGKASWKIWD